MAASVTATGLPPRCDRGTVVVTRSRGQETSVLQRGGEGLGVDGPLPRPRLIEHIATIGADDRLHPHPVLGGGMNPIDAPDAHVVYQPREPDLASEVVGHRSRLVRGSGLRHEGADRASQSVVGLVRVVERRDPASLRVRQQDAGRAAGRADFAGANQPTTASRPINTAIPALRRITTCPDSTMHLRSITPC